MSVMLFFTEPLKGFVCGGWRIRREEKYNSKLLCCPEKLCFPQRNFAFACKELKSFARKLQVSRGNTNISHFHHQDPLGAL